jgi:predicted PurR-regulated permease PerM
MTSGPSDTPLISLTNVGGGLEEDGPHPLVSASKGVPPTGLPIRVHVDARGLSLALLATIAIIFALQWAQKFFIPVVFAVFISYTLNPVVVWLQRARLPRTAATGIVMFSLACGVFAVGNTLRYEFESIVDQLPNTTHRLSRALAKTRSDQPGALAQMQTAAAEIARATNQAAGVRAAPGKSAPTEDSPVKFTELVLAGSIGALGFIGQGVMVMFLVFFLLLSGDMFKRKLVKITGPSLSNKKITVQILDAMNDSIQRYMFMLLVTNIILALLMWGALRIIGLENAGAWAVASGLLHVIPYFGPLIIMATTGAAAFMQFETVSSAVVVAGTSAAIATVVGTFVTTWMTGRIAKMNAAAVFIALLFWGWLWGVWGLLLGVPIVVIIKVIAEHVEGMQSIAELLGE